MIGIVIAFIVGFIVSVVACMIYGQYTLRDMAHNRQIVTECNGRTWNAYISGADAVKFGAYGCLTEAEAAGKVYLRVRQELQTRYKKP